MRIVVCVKEVLDPAAVNNFALAGGLKIGADGKTPEVAAIPRLINGYDEQAIEAAQDALELAAAVVIDTDILTEKDIIEKLRKAFNKL